MKKYIASIVLLLFFSSRFLVAQNSISGFIRGAENQPLAGANIYSPDLSQGTVSQIDGSYHLVRLPNGKIRLQYSFLGYKTEIREVKLTGQPLEIDIILTPTPVETQEIVITGGYSATQHENAFKIDILKPQAENGTGTPNFSRILTRVPGVDMISKGNGISKPVIRGLSMNDILLLNQGVRIENYQYSDHHPSGIDEFGISGVEIIKGPASLLYGSDAIGGVINFLKENPAPSGQFEGDYNLHLHSNSLGMIQNLGLKGTGKKFSGGIRAGFSTHADYLQGEGDFVPNSRTGYRSLKASGGITGKSVIARMYYDYINQEIGIPEEEAAEAITEKGRIPGIFYQRIETHLISSQNKLFTDKAKFEVNGSFQSASLAHIEGERTREIEMRLQTASFEAKYFPAFRDHYEVILGIQGSLQANDNLNHREVILLPDALTANYATMALIRGTVRQKLTLQGGFRYDIKKIATVQAGEEGNADFREGIRRDYGSFSGSVGTTYPVSEKLLFRLNLASAYRTPNLAELTSKGMHEARYELGDAGLVPEKALEADISMHFHTGRLIFDVAGFYNRIGDFIFIAPTGDTLISGEQVYRYLQSDAVLTGGEAGIHYHPAGLEWLHLKAGVARVTGKRKSGAYLPFIPATKLKGEIRAEKEKAGRMNALFVFLHWETAFRQDHPAPEETATADYTLTDLGAGFSFEAGKQKISLQIGIENLFDVRYVDHLSTLKEVGYFNPGRNFSVGLRIPFGWERGE